MSYCNTCRKYDHYCRCSTVVSNTTVNSDQAGRDGLSAYDIAIRTGKFTGTEAEFIDWNRGEKGPKGDKGDPGEKGEKGEKGDPGSGGSGIIFASTPSEETSTNFNDAFPSVSRGSMIIDESKLSVFIKISDTTWSKIPVQILPDEVSELVIQSAYIQSFK